MPVNEGGSMLIRTLTLWLIGKEASPRIGEQACQLQSTAVFYFQTPDPTFLVALSWVMELSHCDGMLGLKSNN